MVDGYDAVLALPCALGAAASFGAANVAQMRAARRTEAHIGLDPRLLFRLLRDPLWLAGFAGSVVGFGLQAVALFLAPVVLVQPLIVTELLFALPLSAALAGVRLGAREWSGAMLVAAGLAVFVLVANPGGGSGARLTGEKWLLVTLPVAFAVAVLTVVAETHRDRAMLRASCLAAAASVCFGLMSVTTKLVGHAFADDGFLAMLQQPGPWVLTAAAVVGMQLAQTAFRIAPLSVSLPLIDVGEPVVASLLATTAFGEHVGGGWQILFGVATSAAVVATGVAVLDTSPLIRGARGAVHPATDDTCDVPGNASAVR
jgi:drug/metabolite transporter (DMT)-like permease